MKNSPGALVGIVIVVLVIAGLAYYFLNANRASAPTVATSTPPTQTTSTTTTTTTTSTAKTYTDSGHTFTFEYPSQFTVTSGSGTSTDWMTNATTSGKLLATLIIPRSFEPKTNFADAKFTVGASSNAAAVSTCLSVPPSGGPVQKNVVTINGVSYTKYTSGDAAAGNFYETTSYRTVHNGQCYALEYTIHSTNLSNYSPDQGITQFDKAKVQNTLEGLVQSFKFL
jgi:hypothetical protein